MARFTPYSAIIGGRRFTVRGALEDESGSFTLLFGEQRVHVDEPADLLSVVGPGEKVIADFGAFAITLWRDGRVRYVAHADGVKGPECHDLELACWALLDMLGDEKAPRRCFFCRWSDVEPSTGWGNLGCAVERAQEYHQVATAPEPRRRKWGPQALFGDWVDEWYGCEKFEVRPRGYGYRGRP